GEGDDGHEGAREEALHLGARLRPRVLRMEPGRVPPVVREGVRGPGGAARLRERGRRVGRPALGTEVPGDRQEDRDTGVAPRRTRPKTASRAIRAAVRSERWRARSEERRGGNTGEFR